MADQITEFVTFNSDKPIYSYSAQEGDTFSQTLVLNQMDQAPSETSYSIALINATIVGFLDKVPPEMWDQSDVFVVVTFGSSIDDFVDLATLAEEKAGDTPIDYLLKLDLSRLTDGFKQEGNAFGSVDAFVFVSEGETGLDDDVVPIWENGETGQIQPISAVLVSRYQTPGAGRETDDAFDVPEISHDDWLG